MQTDAARLWLVRHGETDWNAVGRVQGHTPKDLNDKGRRQAGELAEILARSRRKFAACYSSDLPRAASTARILAERLGLHVQETKELRERSFGALEGSTAHEIQAQRAALGLKNSGDLADWDGMPGVESNDTLWTRALRQLEEIAGSYGGEDVLVVTHGGVLARAVYRVLGIPDGTARRFPLSNGIVAVLERRTDGFYLLSLGDLGFLDGRGEREGRTDTSRVETK